MLEKVLGVNHPDTALAYLGRGYLGLSLGIKSNASDYEYKALSIFEKAFGSNHLLTASCYNALGWLKYTLGDNNEAIATSEKSMHIIEKLLGKEHIDTADAYHSLGLIYYELDDYEKACKYISMALDIYKKLPTFENKTKEIEKDMEKAEYKHQHKAEEDEMEYYLENMDAGETIGTRDLFLETLTKIGCQYELGEEEDDNHIYFAFQGENFIVDASNDLQYIHIWDMHWAHINLYDSKEFARLKQVINSSNINNSVTAIYTVDEEEKSVGVHCKSVIRFTPDIQSIEDYLKLELSDFFHVHRYVNLEMAKLRDKELTNTAIEN